MPGVCSSRGTNTAVIGFPVRDLGRREHLDNPLRMATERGNDMNRHDMNRHDMNRRAFLATSTVGASAATTLQFAAAAQVPPPGETGVPLPVPTSEKLPLGPLPNSRYPDTHIEVIDAKRFKGSPGTGAVERVATGFRWAEGPAYFRAGRYLIFSDIPNNRQMRLLEDDNHLSVFRSPSYNSNGNTTDRQGRLVSCQHGGRRVVRTELDGTITIIADSYNGKNSTRRTTLSWPRTSQFGSLTRHMVSAATMRD
jgi:hypothetical protein